MCWRGLEPTHIQTESRWYILNAGMSKLAPRNQFHPSEIDSKNSKHVGGFLAAEYDLPKSEYICLVAFSVTIQKRSPTSHALSFLQVTGMASSTGTSFHGTTIPSVPDTDVQLVDGWQLGQMLERTGPLFAIDLKLVQQTTWNIHSGCSYAVQWLANHTFLQSNLLCIQTFQLWESKSWYFQCTLGPNLVFMFFRRWETLLQSY